jgi:hypothetical protein
MLDIEPKYLVTGSGLFDIGRKILQNSSIAKKVLNSATAENFKKAANSAIGQEIKKSVLSGVTEASKSAAEGAFQKLGLPVVPASRKRKRQVGHKKKKKNTIVKKGRGIVYD